MEDLLVKLTFVNAHFEKDMNFQLSGQLNETINDIKC